MIEFTASKRSFEGVSVETAARLVASACDIALILDNKAVIRDVCAANADLLEQLGAGARWIGKSWADLVAPDGRAKVAALLKEAGGKLAPKWRHVNYPARKGGPDIPVHHTAALLPDSGRTIVFGRDLRVLSGLQHRLADAQFALERDLDRVRQSEARYRLLFQTAREPMLILDGAAARVADANPAAQAAFKQTLARHGARAATELFAPAARKPLEEAVARARETGREEALDVDSADGKTPFSVTIVAANRAADAPVFLRVGKKLRPAEPAGASVLVDAGPDGLVVSDADGKILHANRAFVDMAQIARPDVAVGEPIDRWIGREGVDLDVLRASLRQRGTAHHFATIVRGERGATREVEINAASRGEGKDARYVFAVRTVDGKIAPARSDAPRGASRTPEQLAELIGRISLRELVRESTDAIERMCIEAALELTGDNRASAAEMLGLSRQSLYVKLRRYGLAELGEADND